MDQQLTQEVIDTLRGQMRAVSTKADRRLVRAAIACGMTYEQWRQEYVRDLPANLQQIFARMDGAGVDVEAVLRALYDESKRQAVN